MALKGDLETIQLADIFQTLANNQSRGTLIVHDRDSKKHIYFEGGRVTLYSYGERRALRVGRILLGRKKVTRNELDAALKAQGHSREHLGKILVGMGVISEEEMNDALKFQVEEEIYSLFTWKDAHFEFSPDILVVDEADKPSRAISLSLDVQELVMEATRRADEWQTIAGVISSTREVYRFTGKKSGDLTIEDLTEDEAAELLLLFDGTRTVEEVSNETAYGSFTVCRALVECIWAGLVRPANVDELTHAAQTFRETGNIDRCLRLYELAAARAPEDIAVQETVACIYEEFGKGHMAAAKYNHIGELCLRKNDAEPAARYFERSVSIHASDPDVLERLLAIYSNLNDVQSTIRVGKRLGALYDKLGKQEEGKHLCELLLELDPRDTHSRKQLLNILLDCGQFPQAELHYERLAEDYLEQGQTGRAVDVLNKLLVIRPLRNDVRRRIDSILCRESRRKKKRALIIACLIMPGLLILAGIYEFKAHSLREQLDGAIQAAEQQGDYESAAECYRMVIDVYPFSITALQASKKIEEINKKRDLFYGKRIKLLTQSARQEEREGRLESALQVLARLREFAGEEGLKQYADQETARITGYIEEAEALWALAQKYRRENRLKEVFEYNSQIYWRYPLSKRVSEIEFPLLIESLPHGAKVCVNGKPAGTTPYLMYYDPSQPPVIIISRRGFADVSYDVVQKVTQPASEGWKLSVELEKTLLWKFKTSQPVEAPPVVFKDTLILGSRDGSLYCLYKETGKLKWKKQLGLLADVVSQPLILGNRVYAGCFDGCLYCLDARSGAMLWSVRVGGMLRARPTASDDGRTVFITSDAGKIMAVASSTGEVVWSRDTKAGVVCAALPWRGKLYAAALDGSLLSLAQGDGTVDWKTSLDSGITSMPAILKNRLYVGCLNGEMVCLDAASGKKQWHVQSRAAINSTPVFVDDTLVFGNNAGWLSRLSAGDGRLLWRYRCKGSIHAAPTITADKNQVICGTTDGTLYALDLQEGTPVWKFYTKGAIYSRVLAYEGRLYFGSSDNYLYGLEG